MARVRRDAARHEMVADDLRQTIRMRDEFLSVASHELRTPLTTLGLHVELLLRSVREMPATGVAPDRLVGKLESVRRQTTRLEDLVATLLDSTAIAAGTSLADVPPQDLASVAREALARLRDEAARAGVPLSLHADPVVGVWHPAGVVLILTHLVRNAIKFGAGRPVEVRVTSEDGTAILTVRDYGIGVAPEHQARIFRRLERAVPVEHYGGFGLGLWIVDRVVAAMNGTVRVDSQAGEGAAFIVELPIVQ